METFSALLAICAEITGPVNSPHLICVWIIGWVNNREVGYLICYRAHYDVIVMFNFWTNGILRNSSFKAFSSDALQVHPKNYEHDSGSVVFCFVVIG